MKINGLLDLIDTILSEIEMYKGIVRIVCFWLSYSLNKLMNINLLNCTLSDIYCFKYYDVKSST